MLKDTIENGIIDKRSDLKQLKDMIQKVKSNASRDPELDKYINELNALDQTVSKYMLLGRR